MGLSTEILVKATLSLWGAAVAGDAMWEGGSAVLVMLLIGVTQAQMTTQDWIHPHQKQGPLHWLQAPSQPTFVTPHLSEDAAADRSFCAHPFLHGEDPFFHAQEHPSQSQQRLAKTSG